MRTDELISVLARSAAPVDTRAVDRRFSGALLLGLVLALAAVLLMIGPRADWRSAVDTPMFWMKLAFPGTTAVGAFVLLRRLGLPGMRLGAAPVALLVPVATLWMAAAMALAQTAPADRLAMVLGHSWWACALVIAALSVPCLLLALRAVRGLAPTRPALAGAAAGLFAGSTAAFAYAWSCVEMQPPFLAVWYLLGMLIPAAAGAWLGRSALRW